MLVSGTLWPDGGTRHKVFQVWFWYENGHIWCWHKKIAFDRSDPEISVSFWVTWLAERGLLCFWRDRLLYMSVEDSLLLCLVFSTDAVCALWPMWSSGVVQGSLRLSGGGLMAHRLSLCACYGCVYCMCLHACGSIIVILTDTFTLCSWRLVS